MNISDHVTNAIQNHSLVSDSTLHVVSVVSNPVRYHSRYRLFRNFIGQMKQTQNVKLHVVELAMGDRHHEISAEKEGLDSLLQLRSSAELWHKENLINLGVKHLLPQNWRYVAWVDGDIEFKNSNWALESIHELQHHSVIQPWSDCADMGPYGNVLSLHTSFCGMVQRGERIQRHSGEHYRYGHSGFAWAATRKFWENTNGLIDFAILGSGDHHMAWSLINQVDHSVHQKMSDSFKRRCHEWQTNAFRETNGHLAAIPGLIHHNWHGSKRKRYYRERWQILVDNHFDPDTDLRRDAAGVLYLVGKPQLQEDIRRYFRSRNEDGIDE